MPKTTLRLVLSLAISAALAGATCGGGEPPAPASQPEYRPVATVRDIMRGVLDPSSAAIWESVTTTVTSAGMDERAPKTDEEWDMLRLRALELIEAGNMLQVPGRMIARPGETTLAPGIELGPEEIQALVDKDPAGWRMRARALHDAVMPTLEAINAKDARKLEEAGEHIDTACEDCHVQYWYPNAPEPPDVFPEVPAAGGSSPPK